MAAGRFGVPGAPGLVFGGALPRFVAYVIDTILIAIVIGIVGSILIRAGSGSIGTVATAIVALGLDFLYFVGFWTSGGRATLGMRLLHLQIGNAFDGHTLDLSQATRRWIGLGTPLQVLALVPALANLGNGLLLLWSLALLLTTVASPTKQGLHDRFANSAIVRPATAGDGGLILGCIILVALLFLLPFVALILLGSQMSVILSTVGSSV